MTFDSAAWAIDGALMDSALARRALYADSRNPGVVLKGDLKVTQLTTPGSGVRVAAGVGLVLNGYQTTVNEMYVASNPSVHTLTPGPASNPAAKSYIVAVVIGDPDFSQTGHPFMGPSDPPDGEELTFVYVRPVFVTVADGATTLPAGYPGLPLARVDIPANTTNITDAMITDLRKLANPRQEVHMFTSGDTTWTSANIQRIPSGTAFANWGSTQFAPTVTVPSWAKRAVAVAHINGVRLQDSSANVKGKVRIKLNTVVGPDTMFDMPGQVGILRTNLMSGGSFNVESIAGTVATIRVEGFQDTPAAPPVNQRLALTDGTQMIYDIRFFEE